VSYTETEMTSFLTRKIYALQSNNILRSGKFYVNRSSGM